MRKRIISSVVLLTLTISCVMYSAVTRTLFFTLVGILCVYEYCHVLRERDVKCAVWVMVLYLVSEASLGLLHAGPEAHQALFAIGISLCMFSGIIDKSVSGKGAMLTAAGLAYPGFLFGMIIQIGNSSLWLETLTLA